MGQTRCPSRGRTSLGVLGFMRPRGRIPAPGASQMLRGTASVTSGTRAPRATDRPPCAPRADDVGEEGPSVLEEGGGQGRLPRPRRAEETPALGHRRRMPCRGAAPRPSPGGRTTAPVRGGTSGRTRGWRVRWATRRPCAHPRATRNSKSPVHLRYSEPSGSRRKQNQSSVSRAGPASDRASRNAGSAGPKDIYVDAFAGCGQGCIQEPRGSDDATIEAIRIGGCTQRIEGLSDCRVSPLRAGLGHHGAIPLCRRSWRMSGAGSRHMTPTGALRMAASSEAPRCRPRARESSMGRMVAVICSSGPAEVKRDSGTKARTQMSSAARSARWSQGAATRHSEGDGSRASPARSR